MIYRHCMIVFVVMACCIYARAQDPKESDSPVDQAFVIKMLEDTQKPIPIENLEKRAAQEKMNCGRLSVAFMDTLQQSVDVGNAVVFLCDAITGRPIHRTTKQPFNPFTDQNRFNHFWIAENSDKSECNFEGVPVGAMGTKTRRPSYWN